MMTAILKRVVTACFRRWNDRRYHLHLGVHKTGTTYTQTVLKINGGKLRQAGVAYRDLDSTRRGLTPFLVGLSRENGPVPREECLERVVAWLRSPEMASAKKVVISDENLLGFIAEIIRRKGYKGIVRRMRPIHEVLKKDVKVFLTIRNYPDFISSMYCEMITTKPWFPFQQLRDGGFVAELSWLRMYESLVKVFGKGNVIVVEYQTIFSHLEEYLSLLAGTGIEFDLPEKEIRASPSARALDVIRAEQEAGSELPLKKIVRRAVRKYPRNSENPPFDPWTPEERTLLNERYQNDLAGIPCWKPSRR